MMDTMLVKFPFFQLMFIFILIQELLKSDDAAKKTKRRKKAKKDNIEHRLSLRWTEGSAVNNYEGNLIILFISFTNNTLSHILASKAALGITQF